MSEKFKKTCKYLNYVENLLILSLAITACISISAFAWLVCVSVGITSSAVGPKICAIIVRIKKYKSIIKKKKKNHDKTVLLGKGKLSTIEVLISKALMDCYISLDEFVSISNVLREYYEMKEGIKHPETYAEYTANKNSSVQKTKQNRLTLLSNCARKNHLLEKNKELRNFDNISNDWFKMNKIANTVFLTGDKFMPELHLKQPKFPYSACGSFTKHRERIRKFRETGNLEHL